MHQIKDAINDHEYAFLRSLLPQAKALGLYSIEKYTPILKEAEQLVDEMKKVMECEMALASAIRMKDVDALSEAIEKTQIISLRLPPSATLQSAMKLREQLSSNHNILQLISDAMNSKNVSELTRLLQSANQQGITGRIIQEARIILERELSETDIRTAIQLANDTASLTIAIEKAIQIGMDESVVELARQKLSTLSEYSKFELELKAAIKNLSVISSSVNGILGEDIAPLENLVYDSAKLNCINPFLANSSRRSLEQAKKQLELQLHLQQVTIETPVVELSRLVRTAAEFGMKNFKGL